MSSPVYPRIPTTVPGEGTHELRNAVTGSPVRLAMQKLWLSGRVTSVGAHLQVQHVFRHGEAAPIEAVYAFVLPRDAALRRFVVRGESFSVDSELKPTEEAREAYEDAIAEGSLAALVREYADGLVNLSLGNLRPGEEVTVTLEILAGVEAKDDSLRFRFPFTVAPTYHREARSVEAPDGAGEMELPAGAFGDILMPRWFRDATTLHSVGAQLRISGRGVQVSSPSHRVRSEAAAEETVVCTIGAGETPDRDLIVDVRYPAPMAVAYCGEHRPAGAKDGAVEWVARIPSGAFGEAARGPMEVVFLLDCSGSMAGLPMEQAKVGLKACLGCLEPGDRFGIVAFGTRHIAYAPGLQEPTADGLQGARQWVDNLGEMGGTEIGSAIAAAAGMLRPGGVMVLMTDGQVAGMAEILAPLRGLPVRIHALGIGSASQDRVLAAVAETTHGTSRFVTARERVDLEAMELFAEAGERVATALTVRAEGTLFAGSSTTVFSGRPLVLYGRSSGSLEEGKPVRVQVEWQSGSGEHEQREFLLPAVDLKEIAPLLVGAKRIALLSEQRDEQGTAPSRESGRRLRALASLSSEYGLASQAMSLVAVQARAGDVPGVVPKTVVVPVGMPGDTRFRSYFGHARVAVAPGMNLMGFSDGGAPRKLRTLGAFAGAPVQRAKRPERGAGRGGETLDCVLPTSNTAWSSRVAQPAPSSPPSDGRPEDLPSLAAKLQADGGLPGDGMEDRVRTTLRTLLVFALQGQTQQGGPFRAALRRMAIFVETHLPDDEVETATARAILAIVRGTRDVPSEAAAKAVAILAGGDDWERLEEAASQLGSRPGT